MDKLTKDEIAEILERYIRADTTVPFALLEDFKERLAGVIVTISEAVIDTYGSEEDMTSNVNHFFDRLRERADSTVASQAFFIVDVPILIPIEVFALCLVLHRDFLTATMAQISEFLINGILSHLFKQFGTYKTQESLLVDLMSKLEKKDLN
jgi:hypothetical protein